jgi:polyphenol oxidase
MSRATVVPGIVPTRSALLESLPGVDHALTRRVPGMGAAEGNVGYSAPRDRADAWAMRQQWCAAAGLDATRLVTLGQVHGAEVHVAGARHAGWGATPGSRQIGLGDALVTDEPGPVLVTLHADCQPILFVDPGRSDRGPVVAVAHAGWRGTVADVAGRTVDVMRREFGTRPADLHVYLGPAIGPCCYGVGDEVAEAWQSRAGEDAAVALCVDAGRVRFSLSAANTVLLGRAGIRSDRIEASPICTRCEGETWFSHRGQGPHTGRFGAIIAIKGAGGPR